MVLSYTTSPAYHVEYEKSDRYRAAVFKEGSGHYMQIEGLGILKGAPHRKNAERFVEFALSDDFQSAIPLTNWMYPVSNRVKLPASFDYAPIPEKKLILKPEEIYSNMDKWLSRWTDAVPDSASVMQRADRYFLLFPAVSFILLFFYIPVFNALRTAFMNNGGSFPGDRLIDILKSQRNIHIILLTLEQAFLSTGCHTHRVSRSIYPCHGIDFPGKAGLRKARIHDSLWSSRGYLGAWGF